MKFKFFCLALLLAVSSAPLFTLNTKAIIAEPEPAESLACAIGFDPASVTKGEGTTLWWWTSGADTIAFENPIETHNRPVGHTWFYPDESGTYTLNVSNKNEDMTCMAELEVKPKQAPEKPRCILGVGTDNRDSVIDYNEEVSIWWYTENANFGLLNNGVGAVEAGEDYIIINPIEDVTYKMTVFGEGGVAHCSVDVEVQQPNHTCRMHQAYQKIAKGESTSVSVTVSPFIEKVVVDHGVGEIPLHRYDTPQGYPYGGIGVSPSETTTYTVTVMGLGTETTCEMTVEVVDDLSAQE